MDIFFNGDDIGATRNITRGIAEVWQQGLLDGFSILANGEVVEDVGRMLQAHPDRPARIAVHLNLSEGPSVAGREQVSLLVNPQGSLHYGFVALLKRWLLADRAWRTEFLKQVEIEWRAQICKVQKLCSPRSIQAMDGHIHTHMLPFLFPVAARLAREFGIQEIRVSREIFYLSSCWKESVSLPFFVNILKHGVLRICSLFADPVVGRYALKTPDSILGVLHTGNMTPTAILSGIHKAQRRGVQRLEVIVHLGYTDPHDAESYFDMNNGNRNRERLNFLRFRGDC